VHQLLRLMDPNNRLYKRRQLEHLLSCIVQLRVRESFCSCARARAPHRRLDLIRSACAPHCEREIHSQISLCSTKHHETPANLHASQSGRVHLTREFTMTLQREEMEICASVLQCMTLSDANVIPLFTH
jgi:hypothetical protein